MWPFAFSSMIHQQWGRMAQGWTSFNQGHLGTFHYELCKSTLSIELYKLTISMQLTDLNMLCSVHFWISSHDATTPGAIIASRTESTGGWRTLDHSFGVRSIGLADLGAFRLAHLANLILSLGSPIINCIRVPTNVNLTPGNAHLVCLSQQSHR